MFLTKPDALLPMVTSSNNRYCLAMKFHVLTATVVLIQARVSVKFIELELGSESLLSDADLAILNAGWRFIYSLGENDDHQFVGRSSLGYTPKILIKCI